MRNFNLQIDNIVIFLRFAPVLTALFIMIGCRDKGEIMEKLNEVETLMDERPDSSLMIIESIRQDDLSSEEARARYALLKTMAFDKNYLDSLNRNDSLIMIAVNYYAPHDDNDRNKMLAYFYLGRVYFNAGFIDEMPYDKCVAAMKIAEKLARHQEDYKYQGLACLNLSWAFQNTYDGTLSLKYAQKSYELFVKYNDPKYCYDALTQEGNMYMYTYDYENAYKVANLLEEGFRSTGDSIRYAEMLSLKGMVFYRKNQFDSCYMFLREWLKYPYSIIDTPELIMYGHACVHLGELEEAERINRVITAKDSTTYMLSLIISRKCGKLSESLDLYEKMIDKDNAVIKNIRTNRATSQLASFYENELTTNEQRLKNSHKVFTIVIVAVIVSVILLVVVLYLLYRARLERNRQILITLSDELQSQKNETYRVNALIDRLSDDNKSMSMELLVQQSMKQEIIDLVGNPLFEMMRNFQMGMQKTLSARKIEGYIADLSYGGESYNNLVEILNKYYGNIIGDFVDDFPGLKSVDYSLMTYSVAGLSSQVMMILTGLDKKGYYNRRHRIRERIREKYQDEESRYLMYIGNK